jgi:hypothetical protein
MTEASTVSQSIHSNQMRLRNSCDRCTRSKLKCDQEKPSCNRCAIRRQPCVYSRARRAGRPPRTSRNEDEIGQIQSSTKRIRLCSATPTSQGTQYELVRPTVNVTTSGSPNIRSPHLTTDNATDTGGTDRTDEVASYTESLIENTSISQDMELRDSLELNLDNHFDNNCFDTFDSFHMPTLSSTLDNQAYNMIENTSINVPGDLMVKEALSVTVRHPIPELVSTTLSGREQDPALPVPSCHASESSVRKPHERVRTRSEIAQAQIQALTSPVESDFLSQFRREPRCRCTVLLSQLEDSFSHQSYYFSQQGAEIPLDLMLGLEESIQRTHESIFNCSTCQPRLSHLIVILCTIIDWLVKNFGKAISFNVSYDEADGQSRSNSMLQVGHSTVEDCIWKTCLFDILRHRLQRVGRVLREMLRRMSEMDSLSGSPKPNSMLEVGRIMTPNILYDLEHLLGMIELHNE